jgi:hypothetical protein
MHDLIFMDSLKESTMTTQEAYAARLDAQIRTADARLDQMEAQARARKARAEMDEISGLRARRDKIRQQVATAKSDLRDDWEAVRSRVDTDWTEFRRSVFESYNRFTAWDDARERRFIAHLDEAEAALRESAGRDAAVAADARIDLAGAQQELRDKAAAARRSYDAWRGQRKDEKRQRELDDAELELEEASNRYAAGLKGASQPTTPSRP